MSESSFPLSASERRPPQQAALELFQDQAHYTGIELKENNPRYRDKNKPWHLSVFNNVYGTFEAGYDLSRDEAEEMRDWLSVLLSRLDS